MTLIALLCCFGRANDTAEQVLSQGEYLRISGLLHEMLCSICDQAHDRCHKLIVARSKVCIIVLTLYIRIVTLDSSQIYNIMYFSVYQIIWLCDGSG